MTQVKEWIIYQLNYLYEWVFKKRKSPNIEEVFHHNNISTNKWGLWKIKQKHKLLYKSTCTTNGWEVYTPLQNYGVIGYPNIRLDNSSTIVDYDFEIKVEKYKKYNLAFDLWFSDEDKFDFRDIKHEVMIWEDYFVAKPKGKKIGETKDYNIYHAWMDKTKENIGTSGWWFTAFVRKPQKRRTKGAVNIPELLSKIEIHGNKINRVELGTEVYNANIKTAIKK